MPRIVLIFSLSLIAYLTAGCATASLSPITPGAYPATCTPDPVPTFQVAVTRNNGFGDITNGSAVLLINGENISMQRPSGSSVGTYAYTGSVPHDGEGRYRFLFRYKVGYGFFSTNGTGSSPQDRYIVRPFGKLTWSSNAETAPLPDTFVDQSNNADRRPRRFLKLGDEALTPGTSGPFTKTARLTLHNGENYLLRIEQPTIMDRSSGGAVTDVIIRLSSGGIYPATLNANATLNFDVIYQTTLNGSTSKVRLANVKIPYNDSIRNCSFGPVWVDAIASYSPP